MNSFDVSEVLFHFFLFSKAYASSNLAAELMCAPVQ